jgi:diguanylate cyclase (GGDEF)-like protein
MAGTDGRTHLVRKRTELTSGRITFTLSLDAETRLISCLLQGEDRSVLIDPWPWPHAETLAEEIKDDLGSARVSDIVLLSGFASGLSGLPSLAARWGGLRVWCPAEVGTLLSGDPERVSVVTAVGAHGGMELGEHQWLRLLEGRSSAGQGVLLAVDDSAGVLYGPAGWKVTLREDESGGTQYGRPTTLEAVARQFGLVRVVLTSESSAASHTNGAGKNDAAEHAAKHLCPITGLPDADEFRRTLQSMVGTQPDDIWMFDVGIDRIESINATYGREVGDRALRAVAQVLEYVRERSGEDEEARLFRHDGPTFAYLFRGSLPRALEVAEQIRKEIGESEAFFEPLSASIGMVSVGELWDGRKGTEDLLKDLQAVATLRLRIARQNGGNTVCAASPTESSSSFTSGTVLIVDPEYDQVRPLVRALEEEGISVVTAAEGIEALQVLNQIAPDVVVSEVAVPKVDGFGLRERLSRSSEFSGIPFVLLSHRKDDELIRRAASLGVVHYFRKPASSIELSELVKNLIQPRRNRL